MVCQHVEYTIEPETLIAHEVRLARTRKTGEQHSAVPDFPVYTTISLTAHLMKEQLAYTHTHMHDSACIHSYTHARQCNILAYMHTDIYAPLLHIVFPSPLLFYITLFSPLPYPPLLSFTVSPSPHLYYIPHSSPIQYPPLLSYIPT